MELRLGPEIPVTRVVNGHNVFNKGYHHGLRGKTNVPSHTEVEYTLLIWALNTSIDNLSLASEREYKRPAPWGAE